MASWWDVLWGVVPGGAAIGAADAVTGSDGISGAMSSIGDSVSLAKMVWLNVSDYRMWRSLGWLLLGLVLLILGFVIWNRKAIAGVAKAAAI